MGYGNDSVIALLWEVFLAPDKCCKSVEFQEAGPVLQKSEFSSSMGRPSAHTAFTFIVAFISVATFSSVGSVPRAPTAGCYGNLLGMLGSSMADFEISSESFTNFPFVSQQSPFLVRDVLIFYLLSLFRLYILCDQISIRSRARICCCCQRFTVFSLFSFGTCS